MKKLAALVLGIALLVSPAFVYPCLEVPTCPLPLDHKHLESDQSIIILGPNVETWKLLSPQTQDNKNNSSIHGKEYGFQPKVLWRI